MDIFKMLSDIAAVIKKPSGTAGGAKKSDPPTVIEATIKKPSGTTGGAKKSDPPTVPHNAEINQDLHLTFSEAQRAGFQFHYIKNRRTGEKPVIITSIHVKSEKLVIPAYIDGHPVQMIADECRFITERSLIYKTVVLVLPDTLRRIGKNAFNKYFLYYHDFWIPYLSEVYFPKGRIMIGQEAFKHQNKMKRLHFGETAIIGEGAFADCSELESVQLKDCELSNDSFNFCQKLTDVTWENIRCIGGSVFRSTPFEEKQDLLIVDRALQRCRIKTRQFAVPDGVEVIGSYAFEDNKSIESVILPPSVRKIGRAAFLGCENLRDIDLCNVRVIYESAFNFCKSLDLKNKIGADTRFVGSPFRDNPLIIDPNCTNDGIVINKTLVGGRPVFAGNVWQIAEGVRRISGDPLSFELDKKWADIPGMTVIFPKSTEEITFINCFDFAERLVFKNPNVEITGTWCFDKDILLTFVTESGSSDIPFLFPENIFGNAAYKKASEFYNSLIKKGFSIDDYDSGIFDVGLPMELLIKISYKRAAGGYMLTDQCRKRYEDYLKLHMRRALLYAEAHGDKEMTEFLRELSGRQTVT